MLIHLAQGLAVYIGLAALLAVIGRRRKLGAWGYFFASLLLTPLVGLLLVVASDPRPPAPDAGRLGRPRAGR